MKTDNILTDTLSLDASNLANFDSFKAGDNTPKVGDGLRTKPVVQRRNPPASIAGGNDKSMDLSMILNRINASPGPAGKKGAKGNPYLKGDARSSKDCNIF